MIRQLWPLLIGFTIWAMAFVALYAVQALGCVWGWPETSHRLLLVAIWLATMGLFAAVLTWQWTSSGHGESTLSKAGLIATIAAATASMLTSFPVAFTTLCA